MKYDTFMRHLAAPVKKAKDAPPADVVRVFPLEEQEWQGPRVVDTGKDALGRPYEETPFQSEYDVLYSPVGAKKDADGSKK